jgi:hypothetical protein
MVFRFSVVAIVFCGALVVLPMPAQSQDTAKSNHSCMCVADKQSFAQGETACIRGVEMRCSMNQNISSWEATGEACEVSDLPVVNQSQVVTAM